MTTTSSEQLQNSQLLQQVQLQHVQDRCGDVGDADIADRMHHHLHHVPAPTDGAGDPLVTFPESPPVLVTNVSPMHHVQSTVRPKPVKTVAAPVTVDGSLQKYATASERRVSTSKLVKEAYESSSSSSSSSSSLSTVADSQDVLQSLHHAADVRKIQAANAIRSRLAGTIVDHGTTEKTLNKLQVCVYILNSWFRFYIIYIFTRWVFK